MANISKLQEQNAPINCSADMLQFFVEFGDVERITFLNNLLKEEQEYLAVELTYHKTEYKERNKALLFYFQATNLEIAHDYGEVVMYRKLPAKEESWKLKYALGDLLSQLGAKSLKDLVLNSSNRKVIALLTHKVNKDGKAYVDVGFSPRARALALKEAKKASNK